MKIINQRFPVDRAALDVDKAALIADIVTGAVGALCPVGANAVEEVSVVTQAKEPGKRGQRVRIFVVVLNAAAGAPSRHVLNLTGNLEFLHLKARDVRNGAPDVWKYDHAKEVDAGDVERYVANMLGRLSEPVQLALTSANVLKRLGGAIDGTASLAEEQGIAVVPFQGDAAVASRALAPVAAPPRAGVGWSEGW